MSESIREGMRVQVNDSDTTHQVGKVGTVTQTYGDLSFRAVEVSFDSGGSGLYWYYQLDDLPG